MHCFTALKLTGSQVSSDCSVRWLFNDDFLAAQAIWHWITEETWMINLEREGRKGCLCLINAVNKYPLHFCGINSYIILLHLSRSPSGFLTGGFSGKKKSVCVRGQYVSYSIKMHSKLWSLLPESEVSTDVPTVTEPQLASVLEPRI